MKKNNPEIVEFFKKLDTSVIQIVMSIKNIHVNSLADCVLCKPFHLI